jgi:hypothetical protein
VDEGVVVIVGSNRSDFPSIPALGPVTRLIFAADYTPPPAVVKVAPTAIGKLAGSYTLPSGGRLVLAASESPSGWPGVRLTPEGKDAFLLLAGGGDPMSAEREARLLSALEKSRKGDFGPLAETFGVPLAQVEPRVRQSLARMEQDKGPFRSLEIVGTVGGGGRASTWVLAHHEKGSFLMEYVWDGPTVGNVRMNATPPGGLFLPEGPASFASYDLRSGAVSRISFEEGVLVVKTPGGEVRAKKIVP